MTEITICKSNGKYRGFSCLGHAKYAKAGKDIFCSAISVLTVNTLNSIEAFAGDKMIITDDEKSADMQMYFTDEPSKEATLLMKSLELGLTSIADQYGERFVKVVIQEV